GHTSFLLWGSINLLCTVQVYYATTATVGAHHRSIGKTDQQQWLLLKINRSRRWHAHWFGVTMLRGGRTECFNEVVSYLAARMIERCESDGRKAPSNHSLEELARLMACMTLHFEMYQLWSVYTVEGQLFFSGIDMLAGTFNQSWSGYKNKMLNDLEDLTALVDAEISGYRFNLN